MDCFLMKDNELFISQLGPEIVGIHSPINALSTTKNLHGKEINFPTLSEFEFKGAGAIT